MNELKNNLGLVADAIRNKTNNDNSMSVEEMPNNINNIATNDVYSTEETIIGTWIDGKPIYRRVYTGLNTGTYLGYKRWRHYTNINFNYISQLVNLRAIMVPKKNISGTWCINGFYVEDEDMQNEISSFSVIIYGNNLLWSIGSSNYADSPFTLIVEYTKNGD